VAAALLTVPVPDVLSQFAKPVVVQLTIGSVYNWALLVLLVGFVMVEVTRVRDVADKSASIRSL
jgi:hypothetical protein